MAYSPQAPGGAMAMSQPYPQQQPSMHHTMAMAPVASPIEEKHSKHSKKSHGKKGLPTGLEYLVAIDTLVVQQELELLEVFLSFETNNRYHVLNGFGQRVFFAGESTGCCTRMCMGSNRPFVIRLIAPNGLTVAIIERTCSCSLCFWGGRIAGSTVTVRSATGELFGTVAQNCNCCTPSFDILDGEEKRVMTISGPCCGSGCACVMCCDAEFDIYVAGSNDKVGVITKTFGIQELVSDATNFGVRFASDLHPIMKCVILGAVFCIDFSYFETSPEGKDSHGNKKGGKGCSAPGYLYVVVFGIVIIVLVTVIIVIMKMK